MSDESDTSGLRRASARIVPFRRPRRRRPADDERPPRPRVNKLRLALILAGLSALALVSTVFGMMMAVASDLPKIEDRERFQNATPSELLDVRGQPLGVLTDSRNIVLVSEDQIAPAMKNAIVAIEDKRFRSESGVDVRGIGRAAVSDVLGSGPTQGASTITQQFVKNALAAQGNRTVFEKLREAALAYHLSRKWSQEKILREYLNSVYFGNGAYGVESAARTYFGKEHPGCGGDLRDPRNACSFQLRPYEAALLAGVVASPSAYDPIAHPQAARARRDLVLRRMLEQKYIDRVEFDDDVREALPAQADLTPPDEKTEAPYFTSWVRQQIFRHYTGAPFTGLKIYTTLDLELQKAAEQAISSTLPAGSGLPTASLVAIDNKTGEVRAMVGGSDYGRSPFNLATQGRRQPGSAFKPFTLVTALEHGVSPDSTWASRRKVFTVPHSGGKERFVVNNYEGSYTGSNTLAGAMTVSDNSIYAEVGIDTGVGRIAHTAHAMGIRTPISTNYATTLGGLRQGVTPLDMAHAYETLATGGNLVTSGTDLGAADDGPVGIHEVKQGDLTLRNVPRYKRVIPPGVAADASSILQTVVQSGTGKAAALPGFAAGKTGTTENYGDAWFVGWNEQYTVAVWVGYPDKLRSMRTQYQGGPVAGGTYPAEIWHAFMTAALAIGDQRRAARGDTSPSTDTAPTDTSAPSGSAPGSTPSTSVPSTSSAPAATAPASTTPSASAPTRKAPAPAPAPQAPAPVRTPAAPAPKAPAPSGGGSGGAGGAGAPTGR